MDTSSPLLTLPPELTEKIATFLQVSDPDSEADEASPEGIDTATAMSASEMSMYDFCAFRLTCKDVYLKTFKLSGRRYFSTLTVGLTRSSLDRLRDLTSYRNTFDLTISEFPSQLSVSIHRLPSGKDVGRSLLVSRDFKPSADAHAIVACISLACQLGLQNDVVHGPYSPHIYAVAEEYKRAVLDQQLVTTLDYDITTIALSMSTFPKFDSITLDPVARSWHEKNWWTVAGIGRRSFVENEDSCSGRSNMQFTFERVLQAIAQAETLCQVAGRELNLCELTATGAEASEIVLTDSRQHIKLQSLQIQPSSQAALQAVFSRLNTLNIDINDFSKPTEVEQDIRKIGDVLQWLLSSPELKDLRIDFIDDGDTVDDDLRNVHRPDNIWISDQILSMIVDIERSDGLQCFNLATNALLGPKKAVQKMISKHASTLKNVDIYALVAEPMPIPLAIPDSRHRCKDLLRTIAGCPNLDFFSLLVSRGEPPDRVADIEARDQELAMAKLQKTILSPTGREHDHVWVDGEEERKQRK